MPIEMNRIKKECPECKNPTLFNVEGKSYFCNKCLNSFDGDMKKITEYTVKEIIKNAPESVKEIVIVDPETEFKTPEETTKNSQTEIKSDSEQQCQI